MTPYPITHPIVISSTSVMACSECGVCAGIFIKSSALQTMRSLPMTISTVPLCKKKNSSIVGCVCVSTCSSACSLVTAICVMPVSVSAPARRTRFSPVPCDVEIMSVCERERLINMKTDQKDFKMPFYLKDIFCISLSFDVLYCPTTTLLDVVYSCLLILAVYPCFDTDNLFFQQNLLPIAVDC